MCWPYWTESDKMAKQLRLSSRSSSSKSSLAFKSRWQDVEDSVRNFFGDLFCFFDRELSNWKRLPSFRAWDLKHQIAFWYLTAWRLGESMTSWPQMGTPTLVTLMALAVVTNAHVPPTACKSPRHSLSTKTESDQAQGRVLIYFDWDVIGGFNQTLGGESFGLLLGSGWNNQHMCPKSTILNIPVFRLC